MRRVLRGEAGVRSTPLSGSITALDDFRGFDGKTFAFNYKFIKEQKILACTESNLSTKSTMKKYEESGGDLPFGGENWSVRDVYVVEVTPKESRYPMSKRILCIDKEGLSVLDNIIWDRAGKLWKIVYATYARGKLPDGDNFMVNTNLFTIDLQGGRVDYFVNDFTKTYGNGITYSDVMPSALLKRAR